MALAAALPPGWDPVKLYFGMTIILSLVGWTQIARVVRGKIISLREEDFVAAARNRRRADQRHPATPPAAWVPELSDRQPDSGGAADDPGRDRAQLPGARPAAARHQLGRPAAGRAGDPLHRPAAVAADPGPVREPPRCSPSTSSATASATPPTRILNNGAGDDKEVGRIAGPGGRHGVVGRRERDGGGGGAAGHLRRGPAPVPGGDRASSTRTRRRTAPTTTSPAACRWATSTATAGRTCSW